MKKKRSSARTLRDRLRAYALAACVCVTLWCMFGVVPVQAQSGCQTGACVTVGPRLASVDSARGALLNLLLQSLLPGSSVNVSALDWNALAGSDINLNLLLLQLQNNLGVSSTQQVLDTELTLSQLRLAMLQVAQADGNTALINALNALQVPLAPLTGTLQLGNLLAIDFPDGALADINLDILDLLVGGVQLYNYENVLTTPTPVVVNTAALGLAGVARLSLSAQVVEPPVQVCGETGSSFHTAAVRIKLDLDLAQGLNVQPLLDALGALTLGLTNVQLTADVLKLQVYADVARSEGSIGAIDLLSNVVTLQARPGLVGLYIGQIPDSIFFNRTQTITNAVVTPVRATTLDLRFNIGLNLNLPILGDLLNVNTTVRVPLGVDLRAAATGAPALRTVTASPPFPRTVEVPCGSECAGDLVIDLLQNLDIDVAPGTVTATATVPILGTISVDLPTAILNAVVSAIEGALRNVLVPLLQPVLQLLLGGLVDPLLGLLGVNIGEMVIHAEGILRLCPTLLRLVLEVVPPSNPGRFDLSIAQGGATLAAQAAAGDGVAIEVANATVGDSYDLAALASIGTDATHFVPTWRCTDQDGTEHGAGTGASFSLVVPEGTTAALTVTCVMNQRQRSADLSVTKDNNAPVVLAGSTSAYTLVVANAGPDAVIGAILTDALPSGVTLSAPWTCTATAGSACQTATGGVAGEQATITVLLDIAVGGEATVVVPVRYAENPEDFD